MLASVAATGGVPDVPVAAVVSDALGDDRAEVPELTVGELDAVKRLKLLAEVLLQPGEEADVGADVVLEAAERLDEAFLGPGFG